MRVILRPLLISLCLTSTALATTWTVDDDGKADFDNIQAAVDAASDGDEIIVMPGTYTSTHKGYVINTLGKAITLRSSNPADPEVVSNTIIDGENSRRCIVCVSNENYNTVVDGLTFAYGFGVGFDFDDNGDIAWWERDGGCLYNSGSIASFSNCIFRNNSAEHGGAVRIHWSDCTFTNCTFTDNSTLYSGGAIYNDNSIPTFTNCIFSNNAADSGGAIIDFGSAQLNNCIFTNNLATIEGGAITVIGDDADIPTLTGTIFCGNVPDHINSNYWVDGGGNLFMDICSNDDCNNNGIDDLQDIIDGTSSDCDENGIPDECQSDEDCNENGIVDFCDIANGSSSDCDQNGIPDECQTYEDCNENGIWDCWDIANGSSSDCDQNGIPDECQTYEDCNENGIWDCWDIANGSSQDVNEDGIPDECERSETFIVDDDGKADFDNIQAAVDAAIDGDEIIVMPGTYTSTASEVVNMLGKAVWLHSSKGEEVTIIDGEGTRRGITCVNDETLNTAIEGFTITNGYASDGGGMYNWYSSPTLTDCVFTDNTANDGGGMYNGYCYPSITSCIFQNNTASYNGGGICTSGWGPIMLIDTVICGNSPDQVCGNWTDGGGVCVAYSCEDNNGDGIPDKCTNPGGNTILVPEEYSSIQDAINVAVHGDEIIIGPGTYTGVGNWVINPMGKRLWIHSSGGPEVTIIDGEGMRRGIQCIGNETSETVLEGLTITGGYANYGGGMRIDHSSPTVLNCIFENNTAYNKGGGMYGWGGGATLMDCIFQNNTASDSGGGICNWGSYPTLVDTVVCENSPDQIFGEWADGGGVCVAYSCEDNNGDGIPDKCTNPGGNTILVPDDYVTIQEAISVAVHGDEIIIGPGTYTGVGDWVINPMGKRLWIHSSDGPEVTIIDGEGERRGIQCAGLETSETIFEGLTITGGYAYNGGGMYNSDSSPTLTNCIFENNTSYGPYGGGGIYNVSSNSSLTDCIFENNTATTNNFGGGGAVNWGGSLEYSNCVFKNNTAIDGGGMFNINSGPTINNCTFVNNTAGDGGGGMLNFYYSHPTLTDCTFKDNAASYGGGMYSAIGTDNNWPSRPTLDNCIFENNTADEGGGVYSSPNSNATLINTIVCGNSLDQLYGEWIDGGGVCVAYGCDDANDDGIPDDCECLEDINGDGIVGITDLLAVIDVWGCTDCSDVDINLDGIVNLDDLVIVFNAWGACP